MLLVTWKPVGMREVILYTLANAFNLTVMLQKYNDRACVLCQHFWCGLVLQYVCAYEWFKLSSRKTNFFGKIITWDRTNFLCTSWTFHFFYIHMQGCQPPTSIDGEWVIDDVIMEATWRHFLGEKKARKRCCFNCNIWPNWFTSHQSHYCLYYNGIPEFVRKRS